MDQPLFTAGTVAMPGYGAQLALVRTMLPLLGGLLEAGCEVDPVVKREIDSLPEGLVFGMTVFGSDAKLRLTRRGGRFVHLDPKTAPPATLDIVFKHLRVAYLVLSFQESTALAFSRGRIVLQGDAALAMRMTRCLDRAQAVTLPGVMAARMLKEVPHIPVAERLPLAARYYAVVARNAVRGRAT